MILWHMHSKVLQGFYASEVYVVAVSREYAIDQACKVFDKWLVKESEEYWFNPLTSADPGDPEYPAELAAVQLAFKTEAEQLIQHVPENAAIFRRT